MWLKQYTGNPAVLLYLLYYFVLFIIRYFVLWNPAPIAARGPIPAEPPPEHPSRSPPSPPLAHLRRRRWPCLPAPPRIDAPELVPRRRPAAGRSEPTVVRCSPRRLGGPLEGWRALARAGTNFGVNAGGWAAAASLGTVLGGVWCIDVFWSFTGFGDASPYFGFGFS